MAVAAIQKWYVWPSSGWVVREGQSCKSVPVEGHLAGDEIRSLRLVDIHEVLRAAS